MFATYANLSVYDRHKKLINDYLLSRKGVRVDSLRRDTSRHKTDADVIREHHKFLWEDEEPTPDSWETRLAKKYYDKLFKEYCICDLTLYKSNKVALRWRTEKEVVSGKGQFECANKKCTGAEDLRTWEVNFGYSEQGEKKNALVKLKLCPDCSTKLNYHGAKREIKRRKSCKRLRRDVKSDIVPTTSYDADKAIKVEPEETAPEQPSETAIWSEKPQEKDDKSREEEFEQYFEDLFM